MANSRFLLDTNAMIFLTAKGSTIPPNLQAELDKAYAVYKCHYRNRIILKIGDAT